MKLFKHQQAAKNFTISNGGNSCLFMDVGTGKTLTTLSILEHYRQFSDVKLLVVCPLTLVRQAWEKDVKEFTDFSIAYYKDYTDEDIMTINFEAIIRPMQLTMIKKLTKNWMCVIDESTKLRNNRSKITKTMHDLQDQFKNRIILTANPTPNNEQELWGQVNFVIPDFLGENFYSFRNYFFELRRGKEVISHCAPSMLGQFLKKGFKYQIKQEKKDKLFQRIREISFYKKKEECLDLPEQIDQYREVSLNADEKKAYKEMLKHLITEYKGKEIVAETALVKLMKLRQITSGFGYNGELVIKFKKQSKLEELQNIIDELGSNQAIIWINFKEEARVIMQLLGKRATLKSDEGFDAFREGKYQFLVINPKSCAHGLTFINCSYQIFYSLSYSYEEYQQCKGRIHRIGQKNKCTYIHLIANKTIDEELLTVLNRKKDLGEMVYGLLQ